MSVGNTSFSTTELLAAATARLAEAGFRAAESTPTIDLSAGVGRVFEDPANIVAVAVYDTCASLVEMWPRAQAAVVELISGHISRAESKAWDGYLVLLTPSLPDRAAENAIQVIRRDTTRLRKLIATGEELQLLDDVKFTLLPLLPLVDTSSVVAPQSSLELLPSLLEASDIDPVLTRLVVDAFLNQSSLLEALHSASTSP